MVKIAGIILLSAFFMMSGCSKDSDSGNNNGTDTTDTTDTLANDTDTVVADPWIKTGVIGSTETWSITNKTYEVTGNLYIEAAVTWPDGINVLVDSTIFILNNGSLTIQPGVTVRFKTGAYIEVGNGSKGTLIVSGTASSRVLFTTDSNTQNWGKNSGEMSGGIWIGASASSSTNIGYSTIEKATTGIYVDANAGTFGISNCSIVDCSGYGIYFNTGSGPVKTDFADNTISGCGNYPVYITSDYLGNFSGTGTFTGNAEGKNAIFVYGTTVTVSATWKKHTVPYHFSGQTDISSLSGSTVTIEPGVICQFETGAYLSVGTKSPKTGTLIAKGAIGDSIIFTNTSALNNWGKDDTIGGGIWIGASSTNNELSYCSIENATTGIYVKDVPVIISHTRVVGSKYNGITFDGGYPSDSTSFVYNYCTGNTGYGISIYANKLINLQGTDYVTGNVKGGVLVKGNLVWQSGSWKNLFDEPYIVNGVIDIGIIGGVNISIEAGTKFKFLAGSYLTVGQSAEATLLANGYFTSPITFTTYSEGTYWGKGTDKSSGGIWIGSHATTATSIMNCVIEKATTGINVNANISISNCTIQNNQYYGMIRASGLTADLFSSSTFTGNGTADTCTAH